MISPGYQVGREDDQMNLERPAFPTQQISSKKLIAS